MYFYFTFTYLGRLFSEDNNLLIELDKSSSTLNDEISLITKGLNENAVFAFTSLMASRTKYKNLVIKLERLHQDLEQAVSYKRKYESDKHTFNTGIKGKQEEKILQIFHEIEDKKIVLKKYEPEVKNLELFLNVIIESIYKNVVSFSSNVFKSLRKCFEDIGAKNLSVFYAIKNIMNGFGEKLKDFNLVTNNIEKLDAEKMQLTNYSKNDSKYL